jgi:hypothetical protein
MKIRFPEIHFVNLFGGTGNLLFQLAHAHKLASERPGSCVFLIKPSPRDNGHNFEIEELITSCKHLFVLNSIFSLIFRLVLLINNRIRSRMQFLSKLSIQPRVLFIHSDYFQSFEDLISIDHGFLEELDSFLDEHSRENNFNFSLVMHIRAGDYFAHLQTYGVLAEKYYQNCLREIPSDATSNPAIFFDTSSPTLLALSSSKDYELLGPESANSLDLLSCFRVSTYCIIGNSTLSWWGGKLASSNGGKVFVPNPWHKTLNSDFDKANDYLEFNLIESSYL